MIKKILNFCLDLVFPKNCVGCDKEGSWLCEECEKGIVLAKKPICAMCGRITNNGEFCSRCCSKTFLNGVIITAYYKDGPIKELIHNFKYEGVFEIGDVLSEYVIKKLEGANIGNNILLVPVPLHKQRFRKRGYNQSQIIAKKISKYLNYEITENLKRIKNNPAQITLSKKERIDNVKDIFSWSGSVSSNLKNKTIILIDDVYTTGSTLNECAKVLKKLGFRRVWGLVVARD